MSDPTAAAATTDRTGPAAPEGPAGPDRPAAPGRAFGARLMAPLLLGSLLNPVNSTMIATALVAIGRDFHVGAADTAWLISAMYLASAVGQPTMGRLADRAGPRRVFVAGAAAVCAAGLIGALAPGFALLIASRVVLGIGTAAAYPAAMAILRAESRRTGQPTPRHVLGRLSLAALGSAAIGPTLGGLLAATAGWRAVFAVNIPLALLALAGALAWLPPDRKPVRGAAGAGHGAAGAGHGEKGIGRGEPSPAGPLGSPGAGLFAGALVRTYLRQGLTYLVIYCVLYGFSEWLEQAHGYSPFHAGLVMLPMSVAAACCSLAGARTKGIRAPLTVAALSLAAGSAVFLLLAGSSPLVALLCAGALFGIPQGLASTGNQAAVYAQAPPDGMGAAAGLQRTSQYLGAIIAAGLIGLVYGQGASDSGLHEIALIGAALALPLLALTLADRALRPRRPA
ncbi:MFS transporter [Streptomyces sp. NPDC048595]|uniref:MFS transporter n=1 Tax=Streptomyces sp. NPDC048595 TaxID=3365576 RepID=UPI003714F699